MNGQLVAQLLLAIVCVVAVVASWWLDRRRRADAARHELARLNALHDSIDVEQRDHTQREREP